MRLFSTARAAEAITAMLLIGLGKPRGVMTQPQAPIARPRAPGWLSCELCERPASRPHRRLRLTLVRHNQEEHPHDRAGRVADLCPDGVPRKDAANPAMLVLLCSDCCALIVGTIDDDEWRKRINESPSRGHLPMIAPPVAPGQESMPPPSGAKASSV
jgi:hypothetical protein